MENHFPTIPTLVLVTGLIVIGTIALFSFSTVFNPASPVDTVEKARQIADLYLPNVGSNLRVEEIMEFSNHYYVLVQERNTEINAVELLVDKGTGRVFHEPGPNMMWNTKYGHMGRTTNSTTDMPVNVQKASADAQEWLSLNSPGAEVEEGEVFYGYYTFDVSRDGHIFGMLSVNGYTGAVWYHTWHGQFIGTVEY